MRNTLLYLLGIVVLSSCTDDLIDKVTVSFLNGTEKSPIYVATNLTTGGVATRAVDKRFEGNEELIAFVEAGKHENSVFTPVSEYQKLASFKIKASPTNNPWPSGSLESSDIYYTEDLDGNDSENKDPHVLYWDDFSDAAKPLTDSDRGIRLFYGYCYNGGSPSTALDQATGNIGWTVSSDQTAETFKTSDLLFAKTQEMIHYNHDIEQRDKLVIPYTHAMSKVTIALELEDGFKSDVENLENTSVILQGMNTVCTVNAPNATVTSVPGEGNANVKSITTLPIADTTTPNLKKSFSALIAPTAMTDDKLLAKINNVDGNDYELTLTSAILDTDATDDWASQLDGNNNTKPGVNYLLTVKIKKQRIEVIATIQDWEEVTATGTGKILFDSDITTTGEIAEDLKANGFDIYKSTTITFGTKATTVSWNTNDNKWEYTPTIYWENKDDAEYFRALSGATPDETSTTDINESLAMTQGRDVLWGTTPEKDGYDKSAKIKPRTGDVPLEFEHAMSKISVILNSSGDNAVNLSGATVNIINTYNEGKIDLNTGNISDLNLNITSPTIYTLSETVNGEYKLLDQIVIPQSLTKNKDNNSREDTPTFYQTSELTLIYNDNTSLPSGGGTGTYYLTSSLDHKNYTETELTNIYSDGTSIDNGGSCVTYVTSTLTSVPETPAIKYTQDEAEEENAKHLKVDSTGKLPKDEGYSTTYEEGYTPVDTNTDKEPAVPAHYKVNENSKQATTSTLKYYVNNSNSEQHTPVELKSAGDKIMMYIILADGTRYSIELSKCTDKTSSNAVEEWKRGEHYTYEITLGKEEITLRALVKDWVEKSGSGSATLDWD